MNPKQIKLASIAAAVITAGGVGTVLSTWWPSVGWNTPLKHQVDIEQIEAEHMQANQELLQAIQQFNRQWECDERAESERRRGWR